MGIKRTLARIINKTFPVSFGKWVIDRTAGIFEIDLYQQELHKRGFLNYQSFELSGESYFLSKFLPSVISKHSSKGPLVLFDVGANVGKYTVALHKNFPSAKIFSFEPNTETVSTLRETVKKQAGENITVVPSGLSSHTGSMELNSYGNNRASSHASLYSAVLSDYHHSKDNVTIPAEFTTLDEFVDTNNIATIHLLKIDTEGHELEVLKGASRSLNNGLVQVIQFEFGECHIYSRVFLRDFYSLLKGFEFYRLIPGSIMALGEHSPEYEIFRFQNIIAVRKDLLRSTTAAKP